MLNAIQCGGVVYDEEFRKFPGSGLWTPLTGITNKPTFNPQWILGILPITHDNYNVVSSRKIYWIWENNPINLYAVFNIFCHFLSSHCTKIATASVPILFVTVQRCVCVLFDMLFSFWFHSDKSLDRKHSNLRAEVCWRNTNAWHRAGAAIVQPSSL